MEWIAALQQAIIYMEEHLLEEINYEDVAKHVHVSSYEFHRGFSFLTGMTANTYEIHSLKRVHASPRHHS